MNSTDNLHLYKKSNNTLNQTEEFDYFTRMLLVQVLVFLTTVLVVQSKESESKIKIDQQVTDLQQSGANCFLIIAQQYFARYSTLAMVKTRNQYKTVATLGQSSEDLILQRLIEPGLWSMVAKSTGEGSQKKVDYGFEKIHNYVIVGNIVADIEKTLRELSSVNSWNPHAKFLVYFFGNHKSFKDTIAVVLEIFWRYWVINVVVMHPPDEDERGHLVSSQKETFKDFSQHLCYQLATYFPYHSGGCGREASSNSSYARIGNCIRNELIPDDLDVFPEKVPDDLNRCLVKVGTVKSPPFVIEPNSSLSTYSPDSTSRILNMGIEMGIINTISEVANFELQVTMSYWQQQQEANSSTTSGLLKTLYDRQIDIAVGTISPTISEHKTYDFTVQYMQDISAWVVPTGKSLPHWIGVLLVFEPIVFLVMILLLLFFWLATSRMVKYFAFNFQSELTTYKNSTTFFLITVGLLLTNAPTNFPRTRFLKFLLFLWTVMSFYWSTAFSATLISVITNTAYEEGVSGCRSSNDSG